MTKFPTNQVAEQIKTQNWSGAAAVIKKWIVGQKAEEKKPTEIFDAIHAHVLTENKMLDEYLKELIEYKEILKEIQKMQKTAGDDSKIEKIQNKIKEM